MDERDDDGWVVLLPLACLGLGVAAWVAALLLAWGPFAVADVAAVLGDGETHRPELVAALALAVSSSPVLGLVAFWTGRRLARRMRRARLRLEELLAVLASACAVLLLAAWCLLAVAIVSEVVSVRDEARQCAASGACIDP
jgi:hypothetical protein